MSINETRQHLLGKQMHLRNLISLEAQEIDHITKGQHKRGKLVSDRWEYPIGEAKQIQIAVAKLQQNLSELFANIGAEEMLDEMEKESTKGKQR